MLWIKKEYVRTLGNAFLFTFAIILAFIAEFAKSGLDYRQIGEGSFWFSVSFTTLLQVLALFSLTYESTERSRDDLTYRSALTEYRKATDTLRENGLIKLFADYCEKVTRRNLDVARTELLDIYRLGKDDLERYRKKEQKYAKHERRVLKRYNHNQVNYEVIYSSEILDDIEGHKKINVSHSIQNSITSKSLSKITSGILMSILLSMVVVDLAGGFTPDKIFMFGMRLVVILYNGIAGWKLGQIVMLDERIKVFGARVNFIHMFAEETGNIKYFNKEGEQ
jgi:hypothetical protein